MTNMTTVTVFGITINRRLLENEKYHNAWTTFLDKREKRGNRMEVYPCGDFHVVGVACGENIKKAKETFYREFITVPRFLVHGRPRLITMSGAWIWTRDPAMTKFIDDNIDSFVESNGGYVYAGKTPCPIPITPRLPDGKILY